MSKADLVEHLRIVVGDKEAMLPMAGIEGMAIARIFRAWPLRAKFVSRTKFHQVLQKNDVLVLGTHGYLDPRAVLFSHVSLQEKFRIFDLLPGGSGGTTVTKPVVFAACLSGLGNVTLTVTCPGSRTQC